MPISNRRGNASCPFFNNPAEKSRLFDQNCQGWQWFHTAAMFCETQNSPSTVVHGCTTVEDGSNGLTVSIFPRFLSILPDAFPPLPEKCAKFQAKFRTEGRQPLKIFYNAVALYRIGIIIHLNEPVR